MWLAYSLASGFFYTTSNLLTRYLLKGDKDSWAFSFWFSLIGTLVSLPFMLLDPKYSNKIEVWIVLILVGVLIVIQNLLVFKSTNTLSPSIQGAILKFRLVWVLLFGIIFLSEATNNYKFLGTLLTLLAGLIIIRKIRGKAEMLGVAEAFVSTVFYAIVITINSRLLKDFSPATLTFFIFLFPAIINILVMPKGKSRVTKIFQWQPSIILFSTTLSALANLALHYALALEEQSKVIIITEVFLIITLATEHLVLKEKGNLFTKLIAILLALSGAILIKLA